MTWTHLAAARCNRNIARVPSVVLCLAILIAARPARADDQSAEVVDLVVDRSAMTTMTSVRHALVLDDSVCRAEIEAGRLQLVGLKRGDTVVIVWRQEGDQDHPSTLSVHVASAARPPASDEPRLTAEERDAVGHGIIGSLIHIGTSSSGSRSTSLVTPFSWTEGTARGRFTAFGQIQGSQTPDTSNWNLDSASIQWARGTSVLQMLDFVVDLDGGARSRVLPATPAGAFTLRGVDLAVDRGRNRYEFFGGTTVPWFAASRELAGVTLGRQQNDRVYIDATSSAVSVPVLAGGEPVSRQFSAFQTAGLTERLGDRVAVQIRGGAGTNGFFGQGAASYESERASAFVSASRSSPQFGLNQLQLVYAPSENLRTGVSWKPSRRVTIGSSFEHTGTQATPLFPAAAKSDLTTGFISVAVTKSHTLFANSLWTRNAGGLVVTPGTNGRRLDTGLSSRFGPRISNTFQLSSGALTDPLQIDSRSDFSLRDTLSVALQGGSSVNISFAHDRLSPSLVARLRQQINLLAPELQTLFADNPVAFVESPLLPADVRDLLVSLQPVDTQIVVSGQFHAGPRLSVAPTFSYVHSAQSTTLTTVNEMLGYALTWRVTPTLDLQSSLTNALVFDPRRQDFARTTIFGIGLRKTLNGAPRWVVPSAGYRLHGRVFRDLNIDGIADRDEPGLPGLQVQLNNGRTALTDEHGQFQFGGLPAGEYIVRVPLAQLGDGVRATTATDQIVRLYERRTVEADFGVVNFSRLIGNVFNDYALDGARQADAPGIRGIAVIIRGQDSERSVTTDGAGDFSIDDIPPGRYEISIDARTVPPDYSSVLVTTAVEIAPSATAVVNLPMRALRSIGGHVYLRAERSGSAATPKAEGPTLIPLKGVRVAGHATVAVTDEEGRFLLRDLPAGELAVSILPIKSLPEDLKAPTGWLRLPTAPLQVEDATIVIDNPRLLEYLLLSPR